MVKDTRYPAPTGDGYKSIAAASGAGGYYSYAAINSDNTLVTWGDILAGEISPPSAQFKAINGGGYFVGVRTDGTLAAWGKPSGDNLAVPSGNNFVEAAAGWSHGIALRADGSLAEWGLPGGNTYLPDGTFSHIVIGGNANLAIRSDGSLASWGVFDTTLAQVPAGNDFVAVSIGTGGHAMALRSDGSIAAWGLNEYGQCNVPAGTYKAIATGDGANFAVRTDGSLTAWGYGWNTHPEWTLPQGSFTALASPGAFLAVALTPEPATILLLAIGGLAVRRHTT